MADDEPVRGRQTRAKDLVRSVAVAGHLDGTALDAAAFAGDEDVAAPEIALDDLGGDADGLGIGRGVARNGDANPDKQPRSEGALGVFKNGPGPERSGIGIDGVVEEIEISLDRVDAAVGKGEADEDLVLRRSGAFVHQFAFRQLLQDIALVHLELDVEGMILHHGGEEGGAIGPDEVADIDLGLGNAAVHRRSDRGVAEIALGIAHGGLGDLHGGGGGLSLGIRSGDIDLRNRARGGRLLAFLVVRRGDLEIGASLGLLPLGGFEAGEKLLGLNREERLARLHRAAGTEFHLLEETLYPRPHLGPGEGDGASGHLEIDRDGSDLRRDDLDLERWRRDEGVFLAAAGGEGGHDSGEQERKERTGHGCPYGTRNRRDGKQIRQGI